MSVATLLLASAGLAPNPQFDKMLDSVRLSPADLACIDRPRIRTVLKGVHAVQDDEIIRAAFQTIYEDLTMLRPAGNFAVRQLATHCKTARARSENLARLMGNKGDVEDMLPLLRRYFEAIDITGIGRLGQGDLKAACGGVAGPGAAMLANACLQEECEVDSTVIANKGATFEEFVMLVMRRQVDLDNLAETADEECLAEAEASVTATPHLTASQTHEATFEAMADRFVEWEQDSDALRQRMNVGGKQGRLAMVLRGCFAGTRNRQLREALKAVYCDDGVLRAGGDIIFKLMQKAVGDSRSLDLSGRTSAAVTAAAAIDPKDPKGGSADDVVTEMQVPSSGPEEPLEEAASRTVGSKASPQKPRGTPTEADPSGLVEVSRKMDAVKDWEFAVEYLSEGHQ